MWTVLVLPWITIAFLNHIVVFNIYYISTNNYSNSGLKIDPKNQHRIELATQDEQLQLNMIFSSGDARFIIWMLLHFHYHTHTLRERGFLHCVVGNTTFRNGSYTDFTCGTYQPHTRASPHKNFPIIGALCTRGRLDIPKTHFESPSFWRFAT